MNGIHDLGGMHGFGPVNPEPNEPVFRHEWEGRVFALNMASGFLGRWNIDMGRYAREQMPPAEYLATTYYEHWLYGLERLLVEKGLVTAGELAAMKSTGRAQGLKPIAIDELPKMLRNRRAARMDDRLAAPRFKPGDRVRTKNLNPTGHTRLPRYARGKLGVIDRDHGVFILPDEHARSGTKVPVHCYAVRLEGRELWGPDAGPRDAVFVDCFEPYLEPGDDPGESSR
jgi:nitrile hydratase subunit beta